MYFGVVVLVITVLMIFKKEKNTDENYEEKKEEDNEESYEDKLTLNQTYKTIWTILRLPAVRQYALILITCRVKKNIS